MAEVRQLAELEPVVLHCIPELANASSASELLVTKLSILVLLLDYGFWRFS